ncbi:hypothetical protein GTO27_04070 [Candidatus Bathyarchaeota archaeon]|nr:hypothetical protein [Candidatus Bathyarchaeota archaeon]
MVKVYVVYDTKYGNTKLVAEKIVEGMKEVREIETVVVNVGEANPENVTDYDAILIGSPNHYGGPTKGIREFIDELGQLSLDGKFVVFFDTYLGKGFFEKAVKRMERSTNERVPGLKQMAPGLSIRVDGTKGPVADGELSKCSEFGQRIANQLKT